MQIVPLGFLSYRYKKERSVAFKIRQIQFSAGSLPRTPLGELTTLPRLSIVGWKRDTPHHTPPHSAPTQLQRSPCVPRRIPARSTPMPATWFLFQLCALYFDIMLVANKVLSLSSAALPLSVSRVSYSKTEVCGNVFFSITFLPFPVVYSHRHSRAQV